MSSRLLNSALKLSNPEKILLVQQLWDSMAQKQQGFDLSENQKTELDARLSRLKRTGTTGASWEAVKKS